MIKSRTVGLAGHVACMRLKRCAYTVFVGKPERKGPLGKPIIDGRVTLKWNLRK
jgi:hypothetical protein